MDYWKEKTWLRMKVEIDYLRSTDLYERPEVEIMTLEDVQVAFLFYLLSIVFAFIAAILEQITPKKF